MNIKFKDKNGDEINTYVPFVVLQEAINGRDGIIMSPNKRIVIRPGSTYVPYVYEVGPDTTEIILKTEGSALYSPIMDLASMTIQQYNEQPTISC